MDKNSSSNTYSPLTRGVFHCVLCHNTLTTYNVYAAYKRAHDAGRRNIRFVSLLDHTVKTTNPVTNDSGFGIDAYRGVAGSAA